MILPTIGENEEYTINDTYESELGDVRYKNMLLSSDFDIVKDRKIYIYFEISSEDQCEQHDEIQIDICNKKLKTSSIMKMMSNIKKLF